VLAWLFQEPGVKAVDDALPASALSTVNLSEVLYRAAEEGLDTATMPQDFESLGITLVPFEVADARLVEEVRRVGRTQKIALSLGDCCCLATAMRMKLPVVGADRAWRSLRLGINVRLIR
jgi:PIN domain nuclease of toxin-antitoxin system